MVADLDKLLKADCTRCKGLCCTALYFGKGEGFPYDKIAGVPCRNLATDYRCKIHHNLLKKGLKGCLAYDCMGAGQHTVEIVARDNGSSKEEALLLCNIFPKIFSIHQELWYLCEVLKISKVQSLWQETQKQIGGYLELLTQSPQELVAIDLTKLHHNTSALLQKVHMILFGHDSKKQGDPFRYAGKKFLGEKGRGCDFSICFLLGSDFSKSNLSGTSFLGADLRGTNLKGADLSAAFFLTYGQVASAMGDDTTLLPSHLSRPSHWGL